ncbi:hypothetical protein ACFE33_07720 [Falsihalocynthiibacter sp. SS001]|uniref:hypothetical protein n=1 Tax=Falsihalocynthiibacter sp. SS001 TaxID=3349698 RepID=UPI0036D40664
MKIQTLILVSAAIALGACSSESRYNPLTWGGSQEVATSLAPEGGYVVVKDPRGLVTDITEMSVVNTNGGVIVHVTGHPPTQGYHTADLVPRNGELPNKGILEYEFRIVEPTRDHRSSTQVSREVVVAHFISNAKLRNVSGITVYSATNSRTSRSQ